MLTNFENLTTVLRTYSLLAVAAMLATTVGCATPGRMFQGANSGAHDIAAATKFERELNIARLLENHDQVGDASAVYERVAKIDPGNRVANHRLGVLAARRKDYTAAHEYLAIAQQGGQPSAELLTDIGYVYYLENNLADAEATFRESLKVDSYSKQTRNNLGLVLARQGRDREALAEFRQSVGEAEALSNLAYVQTQIGAIDEAEKNYHKALDRNNNLKPAAEALLQIASMKGALDIAPIDMTEQIARRKAAPANQPEPSKVTTPTTIATEAIVEEDVALSQPAKYVQQVSHELEASVNTDAPADGSFQVEPAVQFDVDALKKVAPMASGSFSDMPNEASPKSDEGDVIRMNYGDYAQPETIPTTIPTPQIPEVRMLPAVPSEPTPSTAATISISG